ncbi:hypothetical protein [Microbacterium rhizophilus]|uniref:hypothetical protein n=1 Tax=Microbacterium rhizophilus TaxID=3138934 RepID=UPI0031EB356F
MPRRDLDLIRNVDEALRGDAFDLMAYASTVLEMLRRPLDAEGNPVSGMPTLAEMVDRTLADAVRQSDALLLAMATLLEGSGSGDTALAERVRTEAAGRWRTLPGWIAQGGAPEITGVAAFDHVLGADATILIGAILADGTPVTATVFIDRDGGGTIGDAFLAPETLQAALAAGGRGVDADEFPRVEISAADARARVERAVADDLTLEPPLVTATWPSSRPLLAWILRALPDGGSGFPRPAADAALDDELAGAVARREPDAEAHARLLIALNREHSGAGDPRLWSDTFVEALLLELLPFEEQTEAEPEGMLAALKILIEEGHARAGVADRLTARSLEAVDELEDALLDLLELDDEAPAGGDHELTLLAARVGGRRHLDALDAVPMTRVVPDHRGLDERARAGVERVRALIERACGELFADPELAISATRIADLLADTDPRLFAKGKPELAAAAIAWIAGTANDAFAPAGAADPAALMATLGLRGGTPAARAGAYLAALGVGDPESWPSLPALGDPSLLTSRTRRDLIRRRDEARAPGPAA